MVREIRLFFDPEYRIANREKYHINHVPVNEEIGTQHADHLSILKF